MAVAQRKVDQSSSAATPNGGGGVVSMVVTLEGRKGKDSARTSEREVRCHLCRRWRRGGQSQAGDGSLWWCGWSVVVAALRGRDGVGGGKKGGGLGMLE